MAKYEEKVKKGIGKFNKYTKITFLEHVASIEFYIS